MTQKDLKDVVDWLPNDTKDCLEYLQKTESIENELEAQNATETIFLFVKQILTNNNQFKSLNQSTINLAFRAYYRLIQTFQFSDDALSAFLKDYQHQYKFATNDRNYFLTLYALLLVENGKHVNTELLKQNCLLALKESMYSNSTIILEILKTINLLVKKIPSLEINITLNDAYICLQSNQKGVREEILFAFNNSCKQKEQALKYFQHIIQFYPWTNRNKYFLLSCILKEYTLCDLLKDNNHHLDEFFAGLRLSLSCKHLLPASQCLVKVLSNQESQHLLDLSVDILANGSLKETINFRTQWFPRMKQKNELFQCLQRNSKIENMFQHSILKPKTSMESHRFVLVFCMYSHEIFNTSKLHFFKISTELITNCFHFENDIQLWIYKCVVDNMTFFALEDCLDFFLDFITHHKGIENAEMRNNILAKIAIIINYTAKCFVKILKRNTTNGKTTTLDFSIKNFFLHLHEIIDLDISNELYQPKIFALKLLKILYQSLYQEKLEKNVKNSNLEVNEKLGEFLIMQNVFDLEKTTMNLVNALNDPLGYDDIMDLIVELLFRIQTANADKMVIQCKTFSQTTNIEQCMLCHRFAKVALQSSNKVTASLNLFTFAKSQLENLITIFSQDPVLTCKQKNHLFGFLNIINEVLLLNPTHPNYNYDEIIEILERIETMILALLNVSNTEKQDVSIAPSFQDMDESLEILLQRSKLKVENHEECRKFLLMSFWLTLKACCDVATTIGCLLDIEKDEDNLVFSQLNKCLNIQIAVLTHCRHKGAIEAAGVTIGRLTKHLTSFKSLPIKVYNLLRNCISLLFVDGKQVSTTRRGAGFSIMFLHIIKNDEQQGHPLLQYAMKEVFQRLKNLEEISSLDVNNCDRIEALTLHYLCVLVKDADLRDVIMEYHSEIMLTAVENIEHPEWTICNAALQLFGALIPKILGQRRATENEITSDWEPTEITYKEIVRNLPYAYDYIMKYCSNQLKRNILTRSIILFLEFLSKIDHLQQDVFDDFENIIERLHATMWLFLAHPCEKVRKLASLCYVRCHEFRYHLPAFLLQVSNVIFNIENENLFEGLIFVLSDGYLKLQNEALHTFNSREYVSFFNILRLSLENNFRYQGKFKLYTQTKLLEMLLTIGFDNKSNVVDNFVKLINENHLDHRPDIGYDKWHQKLKEIGKI